MVEKKSDAQLHVVPICPVCRSKACKPLCDVDQFNIWRCPQCATDFVWPMPDNQTLKNLYDRKNWFEGGEKGGYQSYDAQTENLIPIFSSILDEFEEKTSSSRSILDVGCGYGTHLETAARRGWKAFGVEVSEHARKVAIERHGSTLHIVDRIENLIPHEFDLILMFDVIEHLRDPYELFYDLFSKGTITPSTSIIITTPNARSYEAVSDPKNWAFRHPPSHLVYYSGESLNVLLTRLHFSDVKISGEHFLAIKKRATYGDENASLNDSLRGYSGLLCKAQGSDFMKFMHERYVPGTWSKIAEYEHIPKYLFAQLMVRGGKVLDFGCGTGYGSALLAQTGETVVGLDIDDAALEWASQLYQSPRLRFEKRVDLGKGLPDQSFDMITCFEMIEHVDEGTQIETVRTFKRLLTPGGKLVISTPNPEITINYGDNPYHVRELNEKEFEQLLRSHFKHIVMLSQWIRPSVVIASGPWMESLLNVSDKSIDCRRHQSSISPVAYIAVCSDEPVPEIQGISYFDSSFNYIKKTIEIDRRLNELTFENYTWNQADLHVKKELQEVKKELQEAYQKIDNQRVQIETKDRMLQEIYASRGWHWLTRIRRIRQKLSFQKLLSQIEKEDLTDYKTYRVKMIHPIQKHRPKIVHVIANLMTGGSSRLIVDLVELLGHKYDQEVITSFVPSPLAYSGFRFHSFSGSITIDKLASFLRGKEVKILHVHYWGECDREWYRKVFQAAEHYPCRLIENINTPVAPYVSDRVDQYVYVSNYAMNFSTPVSQKSTVIYPGSNLTMFQRNGAPIPDDVIGMVYRLEGDKLREDSIQVFIEVVKKRPKTIAYIIGGGTFLDCYKEQVASQGVTSNFIFTGYVAYERLPEYYKKFSLFIAPVWKESFGQVTPFAMSMRIPVVGYNVEALHEILGSSEYLGNNTKEITEIIIDLLDDRKKRLEIGAANYTRVFELFSVDAMVKKYDLLYRQLLGKL